MKRKLLLVLTALLTTVILVACGDSKRKETLIIATGADPVTFDIQATNDQATTRIARQIYETLITQTNELELKPGLAKSWKDIGNNTFEFKLQEGVKFHNGESFTAKDVEWTLKRAAQSTTISHIVGTLDPEKIKVVDDYTIEVGTKTPFGPFLTHLAHPATAIMNEKAVTDGGEDYGTKSPVGTGPYKFVSWVSESSVKLERFEDYYGEAGKMKYIEFKTIKEASVRLIELETGAVDIAYDPSPTDLAKIKENSKLSLAQTNNLGAEYLGLNLNKSALLKDKNVRKAIAHIMDVNALVESIFQNVGSPMSGPINELVSGFNADLKAYTFDEALAKEYMAKSAFPSGGALTLFVGDNNNERILVAQVVKEQLKKIGIEVTVTQLQWATFLDKTSMGESDLFLLGWTTVTTDADYGLYPLFHSQSSASAGNRSFYANARVDELLEIGRTSNDVAARLAAYKEAQVIIHDELPWVFLQTRQNVSAYAKTVTGFAHHPTGSYFLSGVSR